MKRIIIFLILILNSVVSLGQTREHVGDYGMYGFSRLSDEIISEYDIVRTDKNGNVIWMERLANSSLSPFDSTLGAYIIYGETSLLGNKVVGSPSDYDYWLIPVTDNVNVSVYPNPSSDVMYVFISKITSTTRMFIYNMLGELIYDDHIYDTITKIDVKNLPAGIYLYVIRVSNEPIKTGKLCVN